MLVDGGWSSWSLWSRCDRVCGGGKRQRLRSCTNPPPSSGGKGCGSHYYESKECAVNKCPGLSVFAFRPFAVSPWSSVCLSISPSFFLFVCLPIYLSFWLFVGQKDRLSVHLAVFLIVCLSFVFIWRSVFLTLFLPVSLSVCLLVCLSVRLRVCLCVRQDFSLSGGLFVCAYVCPAICFFLFVRIFVFFCLSVCLTVWLSVSAFALSLSVIQVLLVSCALFTSCGVMCCLSVCLSISFLFACCLSEGCYSLFADTFLFFPFISVTYLSIHNHRSYLYEVTDKGWQCNKVCNG